MKKLQPYNIDDDVVLTIEEYVFNNSMQNFIQFSVEMYIAISYTLEPNFYLPLFTMLTLLENPALGEFSFQFKWRVLLSIKFNDMNALTSIMAKIQNFSEIFYKIF